MLKRNRKQRKIELPGETVAVISVKMVSKVFVNERVGEFKLILLTLAWQAKKMRDDVLWQGIAAIFRKVEDQEYSGLVSQRTFFPK